MKESVIKNKSFNFALSIIDLYKLLISKNEYVLSKQILRSGTSIGANVEEASAAQTKKDFAYKMSISSKEARETLYWLKLIQYSELIPEANFDKLYVDIEELIKILTSIVKTTQTNINSATKK